MTFIRLSRTSVLAGALVLTVSGLGASTAIAESVVIQEVFVDEPDPDAILIVGEGFGTDPEVTLGTFGVLDLSFVSNNEIVAELPAGIDDGQYLLLVTVPPTGSSVAGCVDGKPKALIFQYTGNSCAANTNFQEGKLECSGDPVGAEPVEIQITKDADKAEVVPSDESIWLGDSVLFIATGKRLKSSSQFDIKQGGSVLQSLNIHTSCSKPLNVGDQFGSMLLTGFFPEGTDESELRSSSDEFDMVITDRTIGGG